MKNLSAKAKSIYDLLRNRPTAQDENGTYCIYPIKELAMDCAVNEKTVRRSLKELEISHYISCQRQGGNKDQKIYFVHSNSENVHSNSENVHSNSENVHSNSENVHSNSENVHSNFEPPVYYNNYQRNFMYSRFNLIDWIQEHHISE